MIRAILLLVACLFVVVLFYGLLFTGGHSHGASFSAGGIHVEYEINAPGTLRPERLAYIVLSEGEPQAESVQSSDGSPATITRSYLDAGRTNTVSFSIKPGQTVWISKDRLVHVASVPLRLDDVKLIEQHERDTALQSVSSLEELKRMLVRVSAEPVATPNAAGPHR